MNCYISLCSAIIVFLLLVLVLLFSINKKASMVPWLVKDYRHLIAALSIHGLNCYAPSVLIEQEKVQTYWPYTKELS